MASTQRKLSKKKLSPDEKLKAAAERKNQRLMAGSHVMRDVPLFPRTEVLGRANLVWLAGGAVPRENVFECPETVPLDQRGVVRMFRAGELPDFAPGHLFVASGWQREDQDPDDIEDRLIKAIDTRRELERENANRAFYFLFSDENGHTDHDEPYTATAEEPDQQTEDSPWSLGRTSVKVLARHSDKARARRRWPTAPRGPEE